MDSQYVCYQENLFGMFDYCLVVWGTSEPRKPATVLTYRQQNAWHGSHWGFGGLKRPQKTVNVSIFIHHNTDPQLLANS